MAANKKKATNRTPAPVPKPEYKPPPQSKVTFHIPSFGLFLSRRNQRRVTQQPPSPSSQFRVTGLRRPGDFHPATALPGVVDAVHHPAALMHVANRLVSVTQD